MPPMRFIAFACLALVFAAAHAQPTRPPVGQPTQPVPAPAPSPGDKKDATKATAEIIADPLKVGKVAANDTARALTGSKGADAAPASSANINERYLAVAGRGEYTVWANLAQIFVSVQPRVFQAAPPAAANATVSEQQIFLPDDKAKDEIKKVYERVIGVLEKHKAVNISSPASFVASPMFEPNATAFRMLMEHQSQMMARRRKALAQRAGRNLLIRGRPLSMSESPSFGVRALHKADVGMRPRSIHTVNAMDDAAGQQPQQPAKPAEQKADEKKPEEKKVNETATPAKVDESAKKADIKADAKPTEAKEEALVPLPDPKSLINFRGFRFYRPLSAIVPIESVMEIAQSLRAVNASIDSVQLSMSPMAFDEARAVASRAAVDRALAVADAALGAANEKRTKLNTVVISSSPAPRLPRLPMFRAAFLRPQSVNVVSNVVLRVNF